MARGREKGKKKICVRVCVKLYSYTLMVLERGGRLSHSLRR